MRVYVYVCIYMCINTYVYMHIYICIYIYMYIHRYMYLYVCIHIPTYIHTCIYTYIYINIRVDIHTHSTHTYSLTHTYIFTGYNNRGAGHSHKEIRSKHSRTEVDSLKYIYIIHILYNFPKFKIRQILPLTFPERKTKPAQQKRSWRSRRGAHFSKDNEVFLKRQSSLLNCRF